MAVNVLCPLGEVQGINSRNSLCKVPGTGLLSISDGYSIIIAIILRTVIGYTLS